MIITSSASKTRTWLKRALLRRLNTSSISANDKFVRAARRRPRVGGGGGDENVEAKPPSFFFEKILKFEDKSYYKLLGKEKDKFERK